MDSLNSFYGGRQGASFVIVKRFDGIDIPTNSTYLVGFFAKDEEGYFYVPLIERNSDNYNTYTNWGTIPRDGVTTVTSKTGVVSTPLPVEYAQGMKQCFEQGGATTSEVGYGEYIIIDTIAGLGLSTSIDNGKIYRRGMNYDSALGGAEYIGQIIGPKGDSPEINMSTIQEISTKAIHQIKHYNMTSGGANNGIVPGKYINGQGTTVYNDSITYGWAIIKDAVGNTDNAIIGFTFPYLVPEWKAVLRSPYYEIGDTIPAGKQVGDLIDDVNFDFLVDNGFSTSDRDPSHGDTGHAFFRRWKVAVPKGVKGDSQTNLEIILTKMREGAKLWSTTDFTTSPSTTADNATYINLTTQNTNLYPYNKNSTKVAVYKESNPSVVYYGKVSDSYMKQIRYKQTNYDLHSTGDSSTITLGDYNTIQRVWLTDDGYLWVRYTAQADSVVNENPIKWCQNVNVLADGTVIFTYNTLLPDGVTHETDVLDKAIKQIDHLALDTGLNSFSQYDFDGEGTGSQKLVVTWNKESTPGIKDTSVIEGPINYIMEAIVSTYDPNAPETPQDHLLVLYSDPAYRAWLISKYSSADPSKNKIWSYTSQKFTHADPNTGLPVPTLRNDWFDLGYVKGEPGGLHIIGEYTLQAGQTYRTYLDDAIPPENMPGNTSEDRGWAYLIVTPASMSSSSEKRTIYTYDYVHHKWVVLSDISDASIDPTQIVIVDEGKIDSGTGTLIPKTADYAYLPSKDGLWFIKHTIKSVY